MEPYHTHVMKERLCDICDMKIIIAFSPRYEGVRDALRMGGGGEGRGRQGPSWALSPSYLGSYGTVSISITSSIAVPDTGLKVCFDPWFGGLQSIMSQKVQTWVAKWQQRQWTGQRVRSGNRARLYSWRPESPLPPDRSQLSDVWACGEHFTSELQHWLSPKLQSLWIQVETRKALLCVSGTLAHLTGKFPESHLSSSVPRGGGKVVSHELALMIVTRQMTAYGSGVIPSEETVHFFPLRMFNLVTCTVCAWDPCIEEHSTIYIIFY